MNKGKILIITIAMLVTSSIGNSQQCGTPLLNTEVAEGNIGTDKEDMKPNWVSYMYANQSDVAGITNKYEEFYSNNELIKNQHTQFYKRLLRAHSRIPYDKTKSKVELQNIDNQFLKRRLESAAKTPNQWSAIGPEDIDLDAEVSGSTPGTAHVYSLHFCAGLEQHILAGTASAGLWKSSNSGISWDLISADLPVISAKAAAYKPMNPSVIYLAAKNTFYKTINGGITWIETGGVELENTNYVGRELLVNPSLSHVVFLATNKGFYKSVDGGENFTSNLSGNIIDIERHPTNVNIIYLVRAVGNKTEFHKSEDGGVTFTLYDEGYPQPGTFEEQKRTVIAVTAAEPDAVYALAVGKINGSDGLVGIYKSSDQGQNWERRCCGDSDGGNASLNNPNIMEWDCSGTSNGGQYYYDLALGVSQQNASELLTGGINLWKSVDGGSTVQCHSNYIYRQTPDTYVHADIHDIKYVNGAVWIASDGGIFRSTDNATTFHKRMNGLHGTDFRGFDVGFYDQDIMLGGTYHNGTMLKEGNTYETGWVSTRSGDNSRAFINRGENDVIYDHTSMRLLTGNRMESPQNIGLSRKPNASFTIGESSEIAFDAFNYSKFYLGQNGALYRTANNGVTFEQVHNFGSGKVTSIEVSASLPGLIYLVYYPSYSAPKKIMRSFDHGESWTEVTVPTALYGNDDSWVAWDITIGSNSPYNIWAARTPQVTNNVDLDGKMLFFSADGGDSWANITSPSLDGEFPTNLVHQVGTDDVVYVGTRRAVYYSKNSLPFQLLSNGIPAYTFSTKLVPHYKSGKLFNATQRGLYEMEMLDEGILAVPMVDKKYSECLRDTFHFMDHSPMGENTSRQWTFTGADITSSTGLSPKVTYSEAGVYPVKLEVFSGNSSHAYESLSFIEVEDGCAIDTVVGAALGTGNASYAKIPAFNRTFDEMTISAWIKRNGIIYNTAGIAVHREGPNGVGLVINSDGYLSALWNDISPSFESDLYVPYNKWAHVAMTVDSSGITLYVNGQKQFQSRDIDPKEFKNYFFIGSDEFAISNFLNGLIDELSFYDEALNEDEIQLSMNLVHSDPSPSLISYFQANNESGRLTDRVGSAHAYMIDNATRIPSMAPVASGCAELLDINEPGTYNFDCAGVEMTFYEGDILPNGPVSVVKMNELPDLPMPDGTQYCESYWLLNNYGANQTVSPPKELSISGFGEIDDLYVDYPEIYDLYLVPNFWEYGWGNPIDDADSISVEGNTTMVFDQVDNMTYFGKIILVEDGLPALSVWDIKLDGTFKESGVELSWTGVSEDMTYELLKSENGHDFELISQGTGVAAEAQASQLATDRELTSTVLYYKLRAKDAVGQIWETDIISVSIPIFDTFGFYPNVIQSGEDITIEVGEQENVKWKLYDLQGRVIKENTQNMPEATHRISGQTGQYVLEMMGKNISKTSFLIIQ